MIEEVLKYLGITTISISVAYAIIKYLSEKIFENYLQKKIETHKSELERLNISYQIKFLSLHEERAEIIKSLYNHLYEYKLAIMGFFQGKLDIQNPEEHLKIKLDEWTKFGIKFNSTFHRNKIFFSVSQVELINTIDKEMNKINDRTNIFLSNYQLASEQVNAMNNNNYKFSQLKTESIELIEKVLLLEKELEKEFRYLLGV